jgi:hypothetical protein
VVDCYVFLRQQRCEYADPARSSAAAAAAGAAADGRDHRRTAHHWLARQRFHCLHLSGGFLRLAQALSYWPYLFQPVCGSALVSIRIRIRIQLFISMRIRIQGAKRIQIRDILTSHKIFYFYMKNVLKVQSNRSKTIPTKVKKPF